MRGVIGGWGSASQSENRKAGVGGLGKPFGRPNNITVRRAHRHIPLYLGICVHGPIAANIAKLPELVRRAPSATT